MSFVYRKAVSEDASLLSESKLRCNLEAGDKWDEMELFLTKEEYNLPEDDMENILEEILAEL